MRILLLLLLLTGCSSMRMRGQEARLVSGDKVENLRITAQKDRLLSEDNYHAVDVYLRNLNSHWLRVKNIEILSVQGSPSFQVILGEDLKTWAKSKNLDFDLKEEESETPKKVNFSQHRSKLFLYTEEAHLYRPFSIPSGLQTQRWILFQTAPNERVNSFLLKIVFIDSTSQIYEVPLERVIR